MSNIDIVARLQLRAEQFSSETGARFAEMKTRAAATAQDVKTSFLSSLGDVEKIAAKSLAMPKTVSGSLNLSTEIAELQKSAVAADQRAIALRELSMAQTAAASTGRVDADAMRQEADAAAVASLNAEKYAASLRDRAAGLQVVQSELDKTKSLTMSDGQAMDQATKSSGNLSVAKAMLQHQIRAVADSFAAGLPISMIFGEHIAEIGEMMAIYGSASEKGGKETEAASASMVEGGKSALETGKSVGEAAESFKGFGAKAAMVGEFMSGPWGLALIAGAAVLAPFVGKMIEGNHALDEAVEKLKKDAEQSEIAAQAKDKFAKSEAGLAAAIRDQLAASNKEIAAEKDAAEQAVETAKAHFDETVAIRRKTQALLEQAEARLKVFSTPGASDARLAPAKGDAEAGLSNIQQALRANSAALISAQQELNNTIVALADQAAERAIDPLDQINKRYKDMEIAAKNAARGNIALTASLQARLTVMKRNRQADIDAYNESQQTHRTKQAPSLGNQLEAEQGQRLFASASSYKGLDENRDNGALRTLFSKANENVDPKMTAWCAAFVNAVLATNGLPGTGSLSARSFLGYGTSTDKPEKGDIVVARRGTGNQGHVGFYQGTDAKGNIQVLGGNTGDKVATETVKRSDVLGFRRAPTAAESYKADEEAQKRLLELQQRSGDEIARISANWDEQPRLIDRARLETAKLDEIITSLGKQERTPAIQAEIDAAQRGKQIIQDGLQRPFDDYVKSQREGLAIGQLTLQGREVEASALSEALRLQQQMGPLTEAQLATVLRIAEQQQKIADAIEDQRRVVGLYSGAVGDLQQSFDTFLTGLRSKPGAAIKDLASGIVGSFQHLQNSLISEQLFGGMQRDIERYVAQQGGGTTPEEMLRQQLSSAGDVLNGQVDRTGTALDAFIRQVDDVTEQLRGIGRSGPTSAAVTPRDLLSPGTLGDLRAQAAVEAVQRSPANGNAPDAATQALATETEKNTKALMSASSIYSKVGASFVTRLENMTGVKLPASLEKTLKEGLGPVLQGVSNGQLGGSAFASITGGKNDPLASGIGGALGEKLGDKLSKPIGDIFGKTLGSFAGPLGGILGGVLGNVLGGLFSNPKFGTASVSLNQYGDVVGGKGAGNNDNAAVAATGLASSVASGINAVADQLGAKITNLAAVTVGDFDGKYRVATTNTSASLNYNNFDASTLKNFDGDQQAAIEYAIKYALSTSVINGVSQASQNIIKAGSDLSVSIQKALLIESVPKDLKAALDPVGAATDDLNRKFQKIKDAMDEGGATAAQYAQAQQLYNIQLANIKNSTDSASQSLKDFITSLKTGSDSPYSLRDQESTAMTALKPFLDQIAAGQTIDQSKYQDAAKSYLDVERSLYGSTDKYFAALDAVQAATNQAISSIDNAVPITPGVPDPFTKATAASAAATASGVQTVAEIGTDTNTLLQQIAALMAQVAANTGTSAGASFIGTGRAFSSAAAA